MQLARQAGIGIPESVDGFLIPLSRLEEAEELGASKVAARVREDVASDPAARAFSDHSRSYPAATK